MALKHQEAGQTQMQSSLDQCLEELSEYPLSVNRNIRLIGELDKRAMIALSSFKVLKKRLMRSMASHNLIEQEEIKESPIQFKLSDRSMQILSQAEKCLVEYISLTQEKTTIADQLQTTVVSKQKKITSIFQQFCKSNGFEDEFLKSTKYIKHKGIKKKKPSKSISLLVTEVPQKLAKEGEDTKIPDL